jgi:hypothetical protein
MLICAAGIISNSFLQRLSRQDKQFKKLPTPPRGQKEDEESTLMSSGSSTTSATHYWLSHDYVKSWQCGQLVPWTANKGFLGEVRL